MARAHPPWLIAAPTRFAALKRPQARWALAIVALLLIAAMVGSADRPGPVIDPAMAHEHHQADNMLYRSIVEGVRHGGDYYQTTADALRAGGYPLRPFVTFRLPTLAVVEAALPRTATVVLLDLLVVMVAMSWYRRLGPALPRPVPRVAALILLAGGLLVFVQDELVAFHEIWAGLLIALSLAVRRPRRWIEAAAIGMIAMLVRETAALYVALMAGTALLEGERREAAGWGATLGLFAIVVAFHAHAVAEIVRPLDPVSPGWSGLLGFGFFVKSITLATALSLFPAWLAALLLALALFGWAAWDEPLALRALVIFAAYAALIGLFARANTFYWGLMVAPVILIGLAFAPDGLRDLAAAARDKRRITVTRLTR